MNVWVSPLKLPSDLLGSQQKGAIQRVCLALRHAWLSQQITPQDAVIVACSGGADSLALALAVADLCARYRVSCDAVSVDHGLRAESLHEATRVAALLRSWGVRAVAYHLPPRLWDSSEVTRGAGPEGNARQVRYEVLARCARQWRDQGARRVFICLGHTLDDQAETVLLRLARGSGVGSLRAMSPVVPLSDEGEDIYLLRPMLGLRRSDTRTACQQAGLTPIEDPTNRLDGQWRTHDGQPLRRSAVRHIALPALENALGVDPALSLARTARQAALDDDALTYYANLAYQAHRVHDLQTFATGHGWETPAPTGRSSRDIPGVGSLVFNAKTLTNEPAAIRHRVIHRAAIDAGITAGALNEGHVTAVDELLTNWRGQKAIDLPGGRAVRKATLLYFWSA